MTEFSLFLLEMFTKFGAKSKDKQIYHSTVERGKRIPTVEIQFYKFCDAKHKGMKETIFILFLTIVVDIY